MTLTETRWAPDAPTAAKRDRLREIIIAKSLTRATGGEFKLASGGQSTFFFDMKKTALDPEGANLIADLILDRLASRREVKYVGGLETGAIPIVTAIALKSRASRPMTGFFVRKEPKKTGTQSYIEGELQPGATVAMIEDVATRGESVLKAIRQVRALGCTVAAVITIVDRLEGARDTLAHEGLQLESLFTRDDFAV